jgi:vitamin B12 transporter
MTASAGTAFKAPSFNDLYFPGFGNPNLDPERAKSLETSLRWIQSNFQASLTAYQNEIDDLIGFNSVTFAPFNIFETRIRGIEVTARRQLGNWDISGSAERLEPQIRAVGPFQDNVLPRRSETTLRSSLSYRQADWQVGGQLRYEGRRFDDAANTIRVGGFTVLDLQTEWRIDNATRLQLRLDNAFDRNYETVAFYPQPGREVHFLIRYSPGT